MTKIILQCGLSPGDIVTLTAAVRDLHAAYPGEYMTDVRTPCPALWENNPYITRIEDGDPDARVIPMEYPLIHRSNQDPVHFITAYTAFLAEQLGRPIQPTAFKGDIHLSDKERGWMSQVEEIEGSGARFWIIVSGGKTDFTAKWWDVERWQAVVDHFAGRIRFVQVGEAGHNHPALRGVLDLRGKTDLRQLVRLEYHADGGALPGHVTDAPCGGGAAETLRRAAALCRRGRRTGTGALGALSRPHPARHDRATPMLRPRRLLEIPRLAARRWRRQGQQPL